LHLKVNGTQVVSRKSRLTSAEVCLFLESLIRFKTVNMKGFRIFLPTLIITLAAFGLGNISALSAEKQAPPLCLESGYQEIAIIEFKEMVGDSLKTELSGKARLVWNDDFVEGDGEHDIIISQLPSEHGADFRRFAYVGNSGTMKFYPSNTYAARGTDPVKRRFFPSQEAAKQAGFIASKLVK